MMRLIFTDNSLPSINGIEIIKIVKQFYKSKEMKIRLVMVSGEVGNNFKQKVL